jgi:hypothetical protein
VDIDAPILGKKPFWQNKVFLAITLLVAILAVFSFLYKDKLFK